MRNNAALTGNDRNTHGAMPLTNALAPASKLKQMSSVKNMIGIKYGMYSTLDAEYKIK